MGELSDVKNPHIWCQNCCKWKHHSSNTVILINFISHSLYVFFFFFLESSVGEFYLVVCYMSCFPIIFLNFVEGHGELI